MNNIFGNISVRSLGMVVAFKKGISIIRGAIKSCLYKMFYRGNFQCKKLVRFSPQVELIVRNGGKLKVGEYCSIGKNTLLSANKGVLCIGDSVGINRNCSIVAQKNIQIGNGTIIAPNVLIYDHDHLFSSEMGVLQREFKTGDIIIGKNVWIGAGAVILRNTVIGDGSVIAAGCIIKGEYPAHSLIVQHRETDVHAID